MNIDHLRLFLRVANTLNISAAGKEFGLSPTVSSNYISKLELALDTRLIHRSTRKISLTEDGLVFLPYAEDVISSVEAAEASIGRSELSPKGKLRVTAPASFGRMHIVPHIKRFMERYPDLHLDCRLSDSIIDMVEGGFDIAIRNAELKSSNLIARKLAPDNRMICASPDYIKEYGEPRTPEELKHHQCLTLNGLETWKFHSGNNPITIKAVGRFTTDNGEAVRDACTQGLGVTIASTWIAYDQFLNGELIPILKDYPLISETAIWAVYPSSRQLAPKVRAFIDFFLETFGNNPYWDRELG